MTEQLFYTRRTIYRDAVRYRVTMLLRVGRGGYLFGSLT